MGVKKAKEGSLKTELTWKQRWIHSELAPQNRDAFFQKEKAACSSLVHAGGKRGKQFVSLVSRTWA